MAVELFISGLVLGTSRCMLTCSPILLLYIAGTKQDWQQGLKATLVFSFSRLFAHMLLGLLAGFAGMYITETLYSLGLSAYIWGAAGAIMLIIGTLIIFGKEPHVHVCKILNKGFIKSNIISMAMLGFIIGFASYCAPLIGILSYIALTVQNPFTGAFYAFCFGLGSAIITPLLVMGIMAGVLPKLVFKTPKILMIFRRACGVIFLFVGGRIVFDNLITFWQ